MSDCFQADGSRYDRMSYRRAGRSGILLPEISLGMWHNFGDSTSFDRQQRTVRRAFDLGITHFDLANNYGPPDGSAEANFGEIYGRDLRPYRDELFISTKAGYYMWSGPYGDLPSRKNMLASLDQSLIRMGLDYVDVFYAHRPDDRIPAEETAGALAHAVRQGKALYVGLSNYSPQQTCVMAGLLADLDTPILLHQPSYSMFNRHIEKGLLEVLHEVGSGCVVFSPLAQGLLTDRYLGGDIPEDSRAANSRFLNSSQVSDLYLERARGLNEIAKERGQSLAQMALTWILRQPGVTSALVGASSARQLEQNVAALEAPALSEAEVEAIEEFAIDGTGQ